MYGESDEARERRVKRKKAEARSHETRVAILGLLDGGAELSPREVTAQLDGEQRLSVVSYHLAVLVEAEAVDCVGGLYRLA